MKQLSLIKKLSVVLFLFMLSSAAFSFTDMDGKKDTIQNHIGKGKWTIVEIWKSDCHSCREHMPSMVEFDGKLKNARILGISLDGPEGTGDAKDFLSNFDVKFPTLLASFSEVNAWMEEAVGESLRGTPTFVLFNAEGEIIAAQAGIVPTASLEKFIVENSAD